MGEVPAAAFERVMNRIEPENPELTRALWDPAYCVNQHALEEGMLPIDRDYALSLIDAFLPPYVIGLAVEADDISKSPPPTYLVRRRCCAASQIKCAVRQRT